MYLQAIDISCKLTRTLQVEPEALAASHRVRSAEEAHVDAVRLAHEHRLPLLRATQVPGRTSAVGQPDAIQTERVIVTPEVVVRQVQVELRHLQQSIYSNLMRFVCVRASDLDDEAGRCDERGATTL